MSASASRRNGTQPSCEPCRKGKTRCDHQRPICDRCRRRGLQSRCWYHPAPLSKPRARGRYAANSHSSNLPGENHSRYGEGRTPIAVDNHLATAGRQALDGLLQFPPNAGPDFSELHSPTGRGGGQSSDEDTLDLVVRLLRHLHHLPLIQTLIKEYCAVSQSAIVPSQFILPAVSTLQDEASQILETSEEGGSALSQLAVSVSRTTMTKVEFSSLSDAIQFRATYIERGLRLETIGLIYAIAGRACLYGHAHDDESRSEFVQEMFNCSSSCLRLVREIAPRVNDAIIWLGYENVLFTIVLQGDASPNVWRRLGDLTSDVFTLGIHREPTSLTGIPFFLAECRRKAFAAVYQLDKHVATYFDLPPRLSKHYSDCTMPLDLPNEELFEDTIDHEQASLKVNNDGWNKDGKYFSSTWLRLRYILALYREEVLEHPFLPESGKLIKLKNLSERCHETWERLPTHLRYKHDCWNVGLSPTVCLMLTVVYLSYLQIDFQIYRLLEKSGPEYLSTLLEVSLETIATVLQMGKSRHKAVYLRQDFSYMILTYGLPSAVVLATVLQGSAANAKQPLPKGISRSTMIRSLSVFVSHLEGIGSPGETNYPVCMQASNAFSRILDDILDSSSPPVALSRPAPPSPNRRNTPSTSDYQTLPTLSHTDELDIPDLDISGLNDGLDDFDLSDWVNQIDWAGTSGQWSVL